MFSPAAFAVSPLPYLTQYTGVPISTDSGQNGLVYGATTQHAGGVLEQQTVPFAQAPVYETVAPQMQTQAQVAPTVANVPAGAGSADSSGLVANSPNGQELWAGSIDPRAIHLTQVQSKYNEDPAAGNRDCGPTSTAMALRMLGIHIPGTNVKSSPETIIQTVRDLTGVDDATVATTNHDLEKALTTAGARYTEITTIDQVQQAIEHHEPVILNGDPRNPGAYGYGFSSSQMTPFNGAHWICVTGIDVKTGKFIIDDPLSKIGPVTVTPSMLNAYMGGSMGIAVAR